MKDEKVQLDLEDTLKHIEKSVGLTISKLKDAPKMDVQVIPSGSFTVDHALGVGGYPRGRIIEIYGQPSGGKTLLSLLAIAQAQKAGGKAAFIDVEHAFDPAWAKKLGVDVDNLYFAQPDCGEQALEAVSALSASNEFDVIVVDSTASLIPKAELETDLGDPKIALLARLMSEALRRLTPIVGKSKTVVIFINQVRVNPMASYGASPESTPGGQALKFYSSVRLSVSKKGGPDSIIKDGGAIKGHTIRIKVVKNKVAAPFTEAEFVVRYDSGVDPVEELVTLVIEKGIVVQSGPMYSFNEQKWKGRDSFAESVKADKALETALWEALKGK